MDDKSEPKSARAPDPPDRPPGWDFDERGRWYRAYEPEAPKTTAPRAKPPGWDVDMAGNWYRTASDDEELFWERRP